MSDYTTEVRFICEKFAGLSESVGFAAVDSVIEKAIDKIFVNKFPIFDENYRKILETKILKHYYTREIAFESVGLWLLKLETKMNEVMPYFNKLYESELIEFNPLFDVDLNSTHKRTDDETRTEAGTLAETDSNSSSASNDTTQASTSTSTGTTHQLNLYSDTPQGAVTDLQSQSYLTNASDDSGTSSDSSTGNQTTNQTSTATSNSSRNNNTSLNATMKNTEDYLEHITGKRGGMTYSKMLEEYRNILLNIDLMVIDSVADLFFNLW